MLGLIILISDHCLFIYFAQANTLLVLTFNQVCMFLSEMYGCQLYRA